MENIKGNVQIPVNPLVCSTFAWVKNKALAFRQLLFWRNALQLFSLALNIYFASLNVTMIDDSVSVESVVCTVDDQVMSGTLSSDRGFELVLRREQTDVY